jgi:hypothetical protein
MSAHPKPLVLNSPCITTFLNHVLQPCRSPNTLIICSNRSDFLETLLSECHQTHSPTSSQPYPAQPHPLLIPTIHLIATSQNVNVAFTPTLTHLRAYLATYTKSGNRASETIAYDRPTNKPPLLAILNPLSLHQSAGEFGAQGLSRTFAMAVETAGRNGQQLILCDVPTEDENEEADVVDGTGRSDPWREQVPLLNGSVRFGGDQRAWAGRTVEVRHVAGRWFEFGYLEGKDE